MIYTVTFNPALDYVVQAEQFKDSGINRTAAEHIYPGGKGNNVAVVASNLGLPSCALGFKAGFTGEAMEQMLREHGCQTDFIALEEGMTRINVKVKTEKEFEINARGPQIPKASVQRLFEKLDKVEEGDVLVLSGTIPCSIPETVYEQIMKRLEGRSIRICVDAAQTLLLNVLKYRPFLIKPNQHELGEISDTVLRTDEEIIFYAKKLRQSGAQNVLVSMAGEGAILIDENECVRKLCPPAGSVVNSVGAGDSMVAGFLAGYLATSDYGYALRLETAAGSATAFTSWLADGRDILALLKTLKEPLIL